MNTGNNFHVSQLGQPYLIRTGVGKKRMISILDIQPTEQMTTKSFCSSFYGCLMGLVGWSDESVGLVGKPHKEESSHVTLLTSHVTPLLL